MKQLLKESTQKLDIVIWFITIMFFVGSALILWWNIPESFLWASWIIVLMFFVWFSIELILTALKNVKWLWQITGFITNWPEALVLIVWLISWNILFAASTPLGSNVMNPILLAIAIFVSWTLLVVKKFRHKLFFILSFIITAFLAIIFFKVPEKYYIYWVSISLVISLSLFFKKFHHVDESSEESWDESNPYYLPLWIILLLFAWYMLDPVVSYTAEASKAPKWVIWFLVLSTLTSWPEFKSCIALLKRNKVLDAFINILISNLTNIWLAIVWLLVWYFTK